MSVVKPVRPVIEVGRFTSAIISNGEAWAAEMDANTRSLKRLTWLMDHLPNWPWLTIRIVERSVRLIAKGDRIEDVGRKHRDDPFWWKQHYDGSEF